MVLNVKSGFLVWPYGQLVSAAVGFQVPSFLYSWLILVMGTQMCNWNAQCSRSEPDPEPSPSTQGRGPAAGQFNVP